MTTIAWDGEMLAADTNIDFGNMRGFKNKISKYFIKNYDSENNSVILVGSSGDFLNSLLMEQWILDGCVKENFPTTFTDEFFQTLVIRLCGDDYKINLYYKHSHLPITIDNKQWVIGTGSSFAITAMYLGKTAYQAVEIASMFDSNTGGRITTLTF